MFNFLNELVDSPISSSVSCYHMFDLPKLHPTVRLLKLVQLATTLVFIKVTK
jgi:hypothetical protein